MGFVDAGNTVRNRVETVGERGGMEGGRVRERDWVNSWRLYQLVIRVMIRLRMRAQKHSKEWQDNSHCLMKNYSRESSLEEVYITQ